MFVIDMLTYFDIVLYYKTYNILSVRLPGDAVVKNPPANAGDMGFIPSPGRSHMPQSN